MPRMWRNPYSYDEGGGNEPPPDEAPHYRQVVPPPGLDRSYSGQGHPPGNEYPHGGGHASNNNNNHNHNNTATSMQHHPLMQQHHGAAGSYYHAPPHLSHDGSYADPRAAAYHAHYAAAPPPEYEASHPHHHHHPRHQQHLARPPPPHHNPYGTMPPYKTEESDEEDDSGDDDDDDDEQETAQAVQPAATIPRKEPRMSASENEDDDEEDDNNGDYQQNEKQTQDKIGSVSNGQAPKPPSGPRGKPEAMAIALAAATAESTREELAAVPEDDDDDAMEVDDDDDDVVVEAEVADATPAVVTAAEKPKPPAAPPKPAKKKAPPKKKPPKPPAPPTEEPRTELLLEENPQPITKEEYQNLEALMVQFCRVPLLAEFSRPVSLLHPELAASYEKIVKHPVDLGHVCRGIRRRQYKNTRDVRLDMWRVFANCVKFHSHPHNKEAVPTFVSIALHLREYFNSLWQEYMLPSELPHGASSVLQQAFHKRREERLKRKENSGVLMMSKRFLMKVAGLVDHFISTGGCVDSLDTEPIFTEENMAANRDLKEVVQNLKTYRDKLEEMSVKEEDHSIEEFIEKLKECYSADDLLEDQPAVKSKFSNRLDRLVGKIYAPLHEANCRGVTQSSIWGNIATTIWARESSKKAYWPALCLGILPPEDQREGWHTAVTERNELRLPERLRTQLLGAKKKCETMQKKQSLSYFLVEFLGTHEFIWVRETDIVEKFDRNQDPNKIVNVKKKRASRSSIQAVLSSKTYSTALEECEWATEEFEQVLQEAFDYDSDQEAGDDDGEFMNYSYALLNQSDEEASVIDNHGHVYNDDDMSVSDVDEANWLILHEGQIDTSATGRKNAKKRTQAMKKKAEKGKKEALESSKKEKAVKEKKTKEAPTTKKKKPDSRTREREEKREQRELERRRKKRTRDREKTQRDAKKLKKKRPNEQEDPRGLLFDKKRRATAIVAAYLNRMASTEEFKSLALNGIMNVPAAVVDSTGLLGMALAFRAASGELSMPDDSEEADAAKFKPWTKIDCDKPLSHQERSARLEEKVKLLEKEIERVRANTKRRRELTVEALKQKEERLARIMADDLEARTNPFKKRTKPKSNTSTPTSQKTASDSPAAASGAEEEEADPSEAMSEDGDNAEVESTNNLSARMEAAADTDDE